MYYIYKSCLKIQIFPDSWKNAIVIPIIKPPHKSTSYRPISLLPIMGKVLEKIIVKRINRHLQTNNVIIEEQFGCVPNKSTTLQMARIVDKAKISFNINKVANFALLDLEKAYDTVWHESLVVKMMRAGFPLYTTKITEQYLKNRTIQIQFNQVRLTKRQINTGVPQGSILSPILFNLLINDLPKNQSTHLALYADDTAILATSTSEAQAKTYFQKHVNELTSHFKKWKLKINAEKTKAITFKQKTSRPNPPVHLQVNGINIEDEAVVQYLGVHLDSKLTSKKQEGKRRRPEKPYCHMYKVQFP